MSIVVKVPEGIEKFEVIIDTKSTAKISIPTAVRIMGIKGVSE